jgi:hypothetical protein
MRKKRMHIYNHIRRGFGKRNEHERRDDMRSKTISSGRKEGITSREEKERDRGACNNSQNERCVQYLRVEKHD